MIFRRSFAGSRPARCAHKLLSTLFIIALAITGNLCLAADRETRNGQPICPGYNPGRCKDPSCKKGEHVCDAVLKGGRVCGMKNHTGPQCCDGRAVAK